MEKPIREDRDDPVSEFLDERWYTTRELADLVGVDSSSVRRWRTSRPPQGPPFVEISPRHKLYSARDIRDWLRRRRVDPGSAA